MESINTFVGGMNKDASNLIQNKNTYKDALNFGVGRNQGALVNYKGNELSLTIPNTSSVIEAVYNGGNFPITGASGFTINGVYKSVLRNGLTLKGFLKKLADEFDTDTVLQNLGIKVWVNNQNTGLVFTAVNQFVNITYSATADFQFTVKIPVQTDLEVIGWTTIRDTIILLTTNHDTNDFNGIGQIWKLEYNDKSDAVTNLELLYNNVCGFTKYHPMRRVIGRYEIPETQNIYFTDFHNKLRKFNTADPNGFLVDIDNLSVSSAVNLDTPILTDILQSGGSHKTGIVQYAYFLRTTGGQETVFSDLSYPIYILEGNDKLDNWVTDIRGSVGVTTTKSIRGIINYPDADYNRIEVYRIYRDTITSNPTITKIKDENTPSLGPYTFTDSGSENLGTISLDELLDLKYSFTHCKELITKDNILFALNVRSDMDDLPEYDARAFRYKLDNGNYVMDINNISGANEFTITNTVPTNNQIDPKADCIIPNDDDYIYDNSGNVGGIGPNISFNFVNYPTNDEIIVNPFRDYSRQSIVAPGYRNKGRTDNTYTLDSSNRQYVNKNSFEANGAYTSGLLKGFQRGETYRFGIQFFNKEGKPYFVKWICDIKMPIDERICAVTSSSPFDYSTIYNLGVNFQVNTSLIEDKISGYSIVRVKRTDSDKTILFNGLMNHMFRETSNSTLHRSDLLNGTPDLLDANEDSHQPLRANVISDDHFVLVSPEIVINKTFKFQTGDKIYLGGYITRDHTTVYEPSIGTYPAENSVFFYKFYSNGGSPKFYSNSIFSEIQDCKISQAHFPSTDVLTQSVTLSNGSQCYNTHVPTDGSLAHTPNQVRFAGNTCLFLVLDNGETLPHVPGSPAHYYVHYYRPNPNQYGGKGYENRAQNEYIACSRLIPISSANLGNSTSVTCFGGDTFVSVFDHFALFKGWGNGINITNSVISRAGAIWYFPCESSYNFDVRWYNGAIQGGVGTGMSMNRVGYNSVEETNNSYSHFFGDDFVYQLVYSVDNDIVKYLPKPLEFINQQEYDCRIYASNEKINGELTDSWTIWKTNRFYDLESVYGPINGAVVVRNNALVFQDRAFSQILINPTALIQGTTDLILGTGSTIQTHKYISNDTGTKHQFSLVQTDDSVYWLDILKRKFYRFNGQNQSVSDIKGLHSFFQDILKGNIRLEDNPIHQDFSGITGTYNRIRNEVLYTFKDLDGKQYNEYPSVETEIVNLNNKIQVNNKFTISYDESLNAFISFLSFKPTIYINDGKRIITPNPTIPNELYIHGKDNYCEYYGTIYDSTVDIIANDKPIYTKTFDNFELLTEVLDTNNNQLEETFNTVICNTDYQQSNLITLTPNNTIKRKERTWQLFIPRSSTLDRLRDKYIKARFTYNNNNNKKLIFHLLTTIFRISSR